MKRYSWNMGGDAIVAYLVSNQMPTNLSAKNYRFDIKYNEQMSDPEFCAVDFFDVDRNDWSALSGTPADIMLYNLVANEPEFKGADYIYYQFDNKQEPVMEPNDMIDVTPTQGESNVPKLT